MEYLSSYTIYNEVIDGMKAMGISRDELAANLQMTLEELDALLTPTRDYTISEIRHLLGGIYLDIRVDIVPVPVSKHRLPHKLTAILSYPLISMSEI